MNRLRRLVSSIGLVLLGATLGSCAPTAPAGWRGEAWVDSDSSPGEVRLYWFRVLALDVAGRQLLESIPIVTSPGARSAPSASVPVEIAGRFSWFPGGDSIAFVEAPALGERSLAILDLRSMALTRVVTCAGDERIMDAIVSGDGRTLAYTHTPTLSAGGIDYRIRTTELIHPAPVTQSPGRVDFDPAWGGGAWIYFCRGTPGPPNIPDLWRVRLGDAASLQAVTSDPTVYKYRPAVRPLDDLVVYEGRPRNAPGLVTGLYRVDPVTGTSVPLTPARWYTDGSPSWSPDGRSVVFVSTRSGHSEAWSIDVATGALKQLTRGPRGANRIFACWSPDGTRLAVLDGRRGGWSVRGRIEIHGGVPPPP